MFFEYVEVSAQDGGDADDVAGAYNEASAEGSAIYAVEPVTERWRHHAVVHPFQECLTYLLTP